jgi:hypothetical protein
MSLTDLASLGSFISGLGVLVSLLLLVFQLRQVSAQIRLAERNQQAAIQQERYARVSEVNLATTEPSVAEAIAKGMAGARDITLTQLAQYRGYALARFQISESTFLLHKAGLMDDETFAAFLNGFVSALAIPSVRVMWKSAKPAHAAEFVAFVDTLIGRAATVTPFDLLAQWNADLDAEQGTAEPTAAAAAVGD